MSSTCPKCGVPLPAGSDECSCARTRQVTVATPAPAPAKIEGRRVGIVLEGPDADNNTYRIDSQPPTGGSSLSMVDSGGNVSASLSGPLLRGKHGEPAVQKALVNALKTGGNEVEVKGNAQDFRGEDLLLRINGQDVVVQIVSVPVDSTIWRQLGTAGATSISGTTEQVVCWVREALEHKRNSAAGTILALAATHVGAIVGEQLVRAYIATYGDPEQEYPFREIWIVGPTVRSTIRLRPKESD